MTPEERAKYLETYEVSIMCFYFYLKRYKNYLHEQFTVLRTWSSEALKQFDFTCDLVIRQLLQQKPCFGSLKYFCLPVVQSAEWILSMFLIPFNSLAYFKMTLKWMRNVCVIFLVGSGCSLMVNLSWSGAIVERMVLLLLPFICAF